MDKKINILIVEDESIAGKVINNNFKTKGFESTLLDTAEEALIYFNEHLVDVVILDYKLPGMNGEEFFIKIREINPLVPVVFMTAYSSVDKAVRLLKMGAYDYITKPLEIDELNHIVDKIVDKIKLIDENKKLKDRLQEKFTFDNYIFNSEKMQKVINLTLRAADSNASILITGESGTGKEVITNIIHYHSKRKNNNFVKVNLSALPETLMEAELFGATKGAYTSSVEHRTGKFEEAKNGTLFLDEIGDLSLEMQVKLLRAVQEKEITKLGSNKVIKTDIRLITSTNKNLEELIKEGKFREDLYFRLNVINIETPPLRERKEDIPQLIDFFIKKFSKSEGKTITTISKDAMSALLKYNYKGNIRELENIIERGVVMSRGETLGLEDLPVYLNSKDEKTTNYFEELESSLPLPERLSIIEKNIILNTLKKYRNNQTKTAEELGISESGLRYKIQNLKIKKD